MTQDTNRVYTRGGPLTPAERNQAYRNDVFIWRTHDGQYFTLDRVEDDHLLNIELHLMGRSEFKKPSGLGPGNPRWEETYTRIRDEIDRRDLTLKESTGAPVRQDEEDFDRQELRTASGEAEIFIGEVFLGHGKILEWK